MANKYINKIQIGNYRYELINSLGNKLSSVMHGYGTDYDSATSETSLLYLA